MSNILLASLGVESLLSRVVILSLTILFIALFLRRLKQPYFIAYIISGVLLGPNVLSLIENQELISQLGELGLILLMFFIGAEIKLPDLTRNFKKPLLGTFSQVLLSFLLIYLLGLYLGWRMPVIILLSFIISLSSSAVIFQYLSKNKQINSPLGILVTGVLLIQDILVVPMLLVLNFLGKGDLETYELMLTIVGAIFILFFLRAAMKHQLFRIPFGEQLKADHDLQIFIGLLICFGMAWVTNFLGLSMALGAFIAGILIGQNPSTRWLQNALIPFKAFFLALFFIAIGLQLNISFFVEHVGVISIIALMVLTINSLVNAVIFRTLKISWRDSIYAGALLSQIGEFSFVLSLTAYNLKIIGDYNYQITLSVISLTMLLTTLWIEFIRRFSFRVSKPGRQV